MGDARHSHDPDPLIDEVRERRRQLLASYDNDLSKLFEALRRAEAQHPEKLVDLRKRNSASAGHAGPP